MNETNLILLPIGFKPFATPVDFLQEKSALQDSSNAVRTFIKSIIDSTKKLIEEDIEESILAGYNMSVINENRIKNADIIAGITKKESESKLSVINVLKNVEITNEETAKKVIIEEETLFRTVYTMSFLDVTREARRVFSDFKQNPKYNRIMSHIKNNPSLHRKRYLDINKTGIGKDYYSPEVINELKKHYTLKIE